MRFRSAIERAVPHGHSRTRGGRDKGTWHDVPKAQAEVWKEKLLTRFERITEDHGVIKNTSHLDQLGGGNHFIEVEVVHTLRQVVCVKG